MANRVAGKRFAQALFDLAKGQGKEEAWLEELRRANEALAGETVSVYLTLPRVRIEDKVKVVAELLPDLSPLVRNTIGVLLARRAVSLLPDVIASYGELLNEHLGRVQAEAISVVPLSAEQQARIRNLLSAQLQKDVVLEAREDPSIIGGIVVRVGDQVIDGSVRTRLESLRDRLKQRAMT